MPIIRAQGSMQSKQTTNSSVGRSQDWHSILRSQKDKREFLLENEIMADVHFVVGNGAEKKQIPAHKLFLAMGSPVFHSMFYGELANHGDAIDIPDVDPASFLGLLRYLYCEESTLTPDTVMTVLYASKKYIVPGLTKLCAEYIENELSSSNVCTVLMQSIQFDETELTEKSLQLIDQQAEDVFQQDDIMDLDLRTLQLVVARDSLNIDEKLVFEAVERWSERECARKSLPVTPGNRRQVLGEALYLVRMPLMTPEDFTRGPLRSGLLTSDESVSVFACFHDKNTKQTSFSHKLRHGQQSTFHAQQAQQGNVKQLKSVQFLSLATGSYYRNQIGAGTPLKSSLSLTVDQPIWIAGIGVHLPCRTSGGQLAVTLNVSLSVNTDSRRGINSNQTVLADKTIECSINNVKGRIEHINFDKEVMIEPGRCVNVNVCLTSNGLGWNVYYYVPKLADNECDGVNFTVQNDPSTEYRVYAVCVSTITFHK